MGGEKKFCRVSYFPYLACVNKITGLFYRVVDCGGSEELLKWKESKKWQNSLEKI